MVFIENSLNIGFLVFSRAACPRMPYRGYGCIPCFIPEILVYGTLVFELVSDVWGFKLGFQVGCPVLVRHDLFGRSADFWGNRYTGVISVSHFAVRFRPGPDFIDRY